MKRTIFQKVGEALDPLKDFLRPSHLVLAGITALILITFFLYVDLKPKVNENFFFSSDDPQFKEDQVILEIFPSPSQLILGVKGDIRSAGYSEQIEKLSAEVAALPEVYTVQSLTRGPSDLKDAQESPLWKRVIISEDGQSTFVSIFIKNVPSEQIVPKIEKIRAEFDKPDFQVMISGAPYIIELIRRNLVRDFKNFSAAAFLIFGIILWIIFRSVRILVGALLACINASALTLICARLAHIDIGPLTANLSTIVFVLTLFHMIFITFNWKNLKKAEGSSKKEGLEWEAAKVTLVPSLWSMLTTFLGFVSLLFVPATPLQQLGISGSVGALVAMAAAYGIYPWFLKGESAVKAKGKLSAIKLNIISKKKYGPLVAALAVLSIIAVPGLWKLNTDPSLLSYFKKNGEMRTGLDYIDKNGGSSPLKVVVMGGDKGKFFNTGEAYRELWDLHLALEKDPLVGSVVSLPIVLAEARRSPFTGLLSTEWLLKLMDSPKFGEVSKYFVTDDRTQTLFLLRMKETGRDSSRLEVVERIKTIIKEQNYLPALVGGPYLLQGKLSALLSESLVTGVVLLVILFVIMAGLISRSLQATAAMLASLLMLPLCMLGLLGHLNIPIDIISGPATNIAIGMGVDPMVHMLIWVKRRGRMDSWEVWAGVRSWLWKPILCSAFIICAGFAIFGLSNFPPTQRFGFSVVLGTIFSPLAALFVLPFLATIKVPTLSKLFGTSKKSGNA